MSLAFNRIEASTSTARVRLADAFKSEDGAFDLPSILVGVVVVGILTAGVLASIFGVIPFAQDNGAKQDIGAITTAQGVDKAQNSHYDTASALAGLKLIPMFLDATKIDSKVTISGGWATAARADNGHIFIATNQAPTPVLEADTNITTVAAELAKY